ncbi:hypothetical protein N7451_006063 [Penicillium sp. IBT 35674x]|nr:hypothetical protein N7451_006063 [Penicillium sp. IBT 35674x]
MRIFATVPLLVSAVSASTWTLGFYTSKACLDVHETAAFGDEKAMACQNLNSSKKMHAVEGTGITGNWHVKVYSANDCSGTEHTVTNNKCFNAQNLFGDYTTKTIKSFKVVAA